jgi:hypothetical protein
MKIENYIKSNIALVTIRKELIALILLIVIYSGCKTEYDTVELISDNKWHNVMAVQADTTIVLVIKKTTKESKCDWNAFAAGQHTDLRWIRVLPFQNLDKLVDTLRSDKDPNSAEQRTSDLGSLDISQDGSKRIIVLTAGIQLLSRSNQPNSILLIKNISNHDH